MWLRYGHHCDAPARQSLHNVVTVPAATTMQTQPGGASTYWTGASGNPVEQGSHYKPAGTSSPTSDQT